MGTSYYGLWYPKDKKFFLKGFSENDYAGDKDDRNSTSCLSQLPI